MRERRALWVPIAGEQRLIAIEDAGRFRDALGVAPPSGIPAVFLEPVEHALPSLLARFARRRGPFTTVEAAARYGLAEQVAEMELASLEAAGRLVRGGLRPGGTGIDWCDPDVLRRIRRASVAALRREIEPVEPAALARFSPGWHGIERGGRGSLDRLRDALVPLQWLPLAPDVWERDVLSRRVDGYRTSWLDELCATGELVWIGAEGGRVALIYRDEAPLFGPPPGAAAGTAGRRRTMRIRALLATQPALPRRARRRDRPRPQRADGRAVGSGLRRRGHERRLRTAALPAHAPPRRVRPRASPGAASRAGAARPRERRSDAGRRPRRSSRTRPSPASARGRSPSCCSSATAS